MLKRFNIFFLLILLVVPIHFLNAQAPAMPLRIDLGMEPVGIATTSSGAQIPANTNFKYVAILTLADTLHIAKIHVQLDTLDGGNHLAQITFDLNVPSNSENNTTYWIRVGNVVYLGLGVFTDFPVVYLEAKVEDDQGVVSEVKKYNTIQ